MFFLFSSLTTPSLEFFISAPLSFFAIYPLFFFHGFISSIFFSLQVQLLFSFISLAVLGIELRPQYILGRCATTELHYQSQFCSLEHSNTTLFTSALVIACPCPPPSTAIIYNFKKESLHSSSRRTKTKYELMLRFDCQCGVGR